ncbi:hypothetical protein CMQ_3828 [Grosmannia clavigera kw1407]|uniref:LYC1 C-terminal domain-containing protein n=1 Tax=Grosmannia clavigera (strain kw1407 / UAMH 11150) TaxID=655863 RepID=F0X8D2_GROCL|nr:uncharacterized protein CMQ_3828 [Grosmannia clavigera kw1407]EFX05759.1 hypothetical protein CMQ_3828 [Grosmannia clavigera kw1407]
MSSNEKLKASSDPTLVLTHPTAAERERIWTQTHGMWGSALSLEQYVAREAFLTTAPLASDGGITHWILTDSTELPDRRPILSSCESLRKPAAVSSTSTGTAVVTDGMAHGVGSVFTDPQFRGQGYAGRMLTELGPRLKDWQAGGDNTHRPLFSILYSDIGKTFYASKGWAVFPSTHFAFAVDSKDGIEDGTLLSASDTQPAAPLLADDLAALAAADEALLRARLVRVADLTPSAALLPGVDALHWHLVREKYMTQHILQRSPTVHGAIASTASTNNTQPGHRLWVVWTRTYHGGPEATAGNTLHILRVVLEDVDDDDAAPANLSARHADGFRAIIALARAEAARWHCGDVQLWNPTPAVKTLTQKAGLTPTLVDRETDSIASLMWYGEGPTEEVAWVANEKYAWC